MPLIIHQWALHVFGTLSLPGVMLDPLEASTFIHGSRGIYLYTDYSCSESLRKSVAGLPGAIFNAYGSREEAFAAWERSDNHRGFKIIDAPPAQGQSFPVFP